MGHGKVSNLLAPTAQTPNCSLERPDPGAAEVFAWTAVFVVLLVGHEACVASGAKPLLADHQRGNTVLLGRGFWRFGASLT